MHKLDVRVWNYARKEWLPEWSDRMVRALIWSSGAHDVNLHTGYRDKNGIKIYDADILIGEWSEQGDTHKHTQTLISEVCFRAGGFVWHGYPMSEFKTEDDNDILKEYRWTSGGYNNIPTLYYMVSNFRVIGNIYENPELLDGDGK